MKNKTKKISFVVVSVLLIVLLVIGTKLFTKANKKDISQLPKIKLAYNIGNLDTVPVMIAYQKGYFKDEGVNVELVQVTPADGLIAISSHQVDMLIGGSTRLFGPIDKGAPIKFLSPMTNTDTEILIAPNSGIKTLKDLEGKKLSYGTGGSKESFLKNILKKENVDVKKIKFINVDNSYLGVALMDKKTVDAVVIADAGYVDQAKKLGAVVLPEWQDKKYSKFTMGLVVSANTDFLNSNSDSIEKFFKAIIKSNRYLKSNLDDSANIVAQFFKEKTNGATVIDPNNFKSQVKDGQVVYYLWEDPNTVVDNARMCYELGQVDRALNINDLYDLRFKDLLEPAQNEIYGNTKN